jgi:hypothetical protein
VRLLLSELPHSRVRSKGIIKPFHFHLSLIFSGGLNLEPTFREESSSLLQ